MKIAIIGTGKIVPTAISAMSQVPEIEITTLYGRPHSRKRRKAWRGDTVFLTYTRTIPNC